MEIASVLHGTDHVRVFCFLRDMEPQFPMHNRVLLADYIDRNHLYPHTRTRAPVVHATHYGARSYELD